MKTALVIAGLIAVLLLLRKPAAASAKPSATGLQTVDVGNSIAGAPIYNLSGALAARHLGVDNSGASLNSTSTGSTGTSSSNANVGNGNYEPNGGTYTAIDPVVQVGGVPINSLLPVRPGSIIPPDANSHIAFADLLNAIANIPIVLVDYFGQSGSQVAGQTPQTQYTD